MHEKYGIHQEYRVLMIPPHRRHKRITLLSLFKLELRCKWHPSRGREGPFVNNITPEPAWKSRLT